ncbi:hypothetical protein [Sphingobacterium sp. LRF_L2]|uniref:hypothetical protein n=1 Tax=Sphingobacterium sp. LRF_L2 TaxID=3369421 RepID=UPI003F5FC1A5
MIKKLKDSARILLSAILKKKYKVKIFKEESKLSCDIDLEENDSSFYGYYDKSPRKGEYILYNVIKGKEDLGREHYIEIKIKNCKTGEIISIGKVNSYNLQMGARAMWLTDDIIAYNDFVDEMYVCKWYSLKLNKVVDVFRCAMQDSYKTEYFLGVNYRRLISYAPEYGYYCLPSLSNDEYRDYENDGIYIVEAKQHEVRLLHSLTEVINLDKHENFLDADHFVNHIMISPDGEHFIFIHRYYKKGIRYDRLVLSNFKDLKVLLSDQCQSHFCWLSTTKIFGYGQYQGNLGFYTIDLESGKITPHLELTKVNKGDGHPTVYKDWIVIDSYPNLSRMQTLIAYNFKDKKIVKILEVYHDLQHTGVNRCDLHPRFSEDGKDIFIDTIYSGKRRLEVINFK